MIFQHVTGLLMFLSVIYIFELSVKKRLEMDAAFGAFITGMFLFFGAMTLLLTK